MSPTTEPCPDCRGTGQYEDKMAVDIMDAVVGDCPRCQGSGRLVTNVEPITPARRDRSHGGRVSAEPDVGGSWPAGMGQIKLRAIPYDGEVYLSASDVVELAQRLQRGGEKLQSLITHLTGPTVAGQMLVGREDDATSS